MRVGQVCVQGFVGPGHVGLLALANDLVESKPERLVHAEMNTAVVPERQQ
eukprot:COSAG06_NODE_46351_length_347_cov_1.250000_1_plen_49_part_10